MKQAHAAQIVNSTKLFKKKDSLFYCEMFDAKGTIEELLSFSFFIF